MHEIFYLGFYLGFLLGAVAVVAFDGLGRLSGWWRLRAWRDLAERDHEIADALARMVERRLP